MHRKKAPKPRKKPRVRNREGREADGDGEAETSGNWPVDETQSDEYTISRNRYQEYDLRQHLIRAVNGYGMNTPWFKKRKDVLTRYNYQFDGSVDTRDKRAVFYCRIAWLHLFEQDFNCHVVLMTPSKQLAEYIYKIFKELVFNSKFFSVKLCTGETCMVEQLENFHSCSVAIGTPDRIFNLISCRAISLAGLKIFLYDNDENFISTMFKHKIDIALSTISADVRIFK